MTSLGGRGACATQPSGLHVIRTLLSKHGARGLTLCFSLLAAVSAGREIVLRVPTIEAEDQSLSVGVGVATGDAFVGNVHAVDRLLWTALGNTTNLASRLQSLTRDVEAAMIIDENTWRHSGDQAESFHRQAQTEIRGRDRREDVYVLPAPSFA